MKKNNIIILLLGVFFLFNSCIKEEAPNKEADILSMSIDKKLLKRSPIISNNEIVCYVKPGVNLTSLAPTFIITAGANITPQSGTVRDFTTPQVYTVLSEDGEWSKDYTVSFISSDISQIYHFDNNELKEGKYQELYEVDTNGNKNMIWASGNAGFTIVAGDALPSEYPTSMANEGFINHSAKLVTCGTGFLGETFGTPMAAGNLFMGEFKLDISNTLKSTCFGMPLTNIPLILKGYYKYQSGELYKRYTDEEGNAILGGEVVDRKDSCAIYAVFYETDENTPYLDGTNILTHQNIISIAQLENQNETSDWTFFEITFVNKAGKNVDQQKLIDGKYSLAIVFSSSKDGHLYNGALGSTLFIDEVELISK